MQNSIPIWKIAATVGGAALTANAVWLNACHVASAEGWMSPLVAAGVFVTICAAITPPFAERAAKTGQPLKALLLWVFFGLAVSFSLTASIARSGGFADGKVANAEKANGNATMAKEAYAMAKETREAECGKRGPRCRAAEDAVTAARERLTGAAPTVATDPGAKRLAAVTGLSEAAVALYSPLLLPLGLELGGFIFLALGLAPRRREKDVVIADTLDSVEPVAVPVATVAKRGSSAYYVARLQRDFPEIAKRVAKAEISVYAASIEAGLRKAPAKSAKWTKADAYLESVAA